MHGINSQRVCYIYSDTRTHPYRSGAKICQLIGAMIIQYQQSNQLSRLKIELQQLTNRCNKILQILTTLYNNNNNNNKNYSKLHKTDFS